MPFGLVLLVLLHLRPASAQLSTNDPLGFFTNVSSRLLGSEFGLSLNQIQIYPTNQYTPAVHRLMQVSANLWETQTSDGLPSVFRPRFSVTNGTIHISDYVIVTNVSELTNLPLLDLTITTNAATLIPPDGNALIFNMPLVTGARKGLPNFNEFSVESTFVLTRKVQLKKNNSGVVTETNQFFAVQLTMSAAAEFWNSYASNFSRMVDIYVTNRATMTLTNDSGVMFNNTFVTGEYIAIPNPGLNSWPGARTQTNPNYDNPASFVVVMHTNVPFLPLVGYLPDRAGNAGFMSATNTLLFDTSQELLSPRWGMTITNQVHAMIVDQATGRIIDYVLLGNLVSYRNLTEEFSRPTALGAGQDLFNLLWATNSFGTGQLSGRKGIEAQIRISRGASGGVDLSNGRWRSFGSFSPGTAENESVKFNQFLSVSNTTNLVGNVPFSPSISFSVPMLWQANDPLVHYQAGELFHIAESGKIKANYPPTLSTSTNALDNIGRKNTRYKPWGKEPVDQQTDPDTFNLSIKDALVRSSDDWNFPTNSTLTAESLGRVHRGTPWQTIYLKSSDLGLTNAVTSPSTWSAGNNRVASKKWSEWTGNPSLTDGFYMRPVRDWSLASLIATLINTNDPRQLLSVNDPNQNNWLATLDGMIALTNTLTESQLLSGVPAQFQTLTLNSNSTQAALLVQGIADVRANQPGQAFRSIGDLLAASELSLASPWLNQTGSYQTIRGITDEAYEKIPAQLLSRVRADSMGSILPNGASWQIQFTGFDNYPYAVQCSTNLVNWISVSTNYPTNGLFTFVDAAAGVGSKRFHRSVLLP